MNPRDKAVVERALRATTRYLNYHARLPEGITDEAAVELPVDLGTIKDALLGLASGNYSKCDLCSSDTQAIERMESALNSLRLFDTTIATELESVRQMARLMMEDRGVRQEISGRILTALESPHTLQTEVFKR
jgi:hypothetical protein